MIRLDTRAKKIAAATALAAALAAPFEGLRQWAYLDPVGIPTICFGHTEGVKLGMHRTPEQCRALLNDEMRDAVETVLQCARPNVLTVNQTAAFASAVYNVGPALVCGPSTAATLIHAGEIEAACAQLPRWNKARVAGRLIELPGLTTRRAAEKALCLTPDGAPT